MAIRPMNTITPGVSTLEDPKRRRARAFRGEKSGSFIAFETPALACVRIFRLTAAA
jgi:hypothetical protein